MEPLCLFVLKPSRHAHREVEVEVEVKREFKRSRSREGEREREVERQNKSDVTTRAAGNGNRHTGTVNRRAILHSATTESAVTNRCKAVWVILCTGVVSK